MDWVEAQGWSPIILLGRSFGGSTVLVRAARDERARGIILWSTPVFLQETFSTTMVEEYHQLEMGKPVIIRDDWGEFRLNPSFVTDINRQDMDHCLELVSGRPVLIIHGTADEIVKPRNAEYTYNKVGNSAELHLIEGSDHRFVDSTAIREEYYRFLAAAELLIKSVLVNQTSKNDNHKSYEYSYLRKCG